MPRLRDSSTSLRSTKNSNGFSCRKVLCNRRASNFFAKRKSHKQKINPSRTQALHGISGTTLLSVISRGLRSQDRKFFARYYSDKNLKIQISLASLLPSVNSSICFRNYTNTWHNLSNEYQRDSNCYPTNLWSSLDLFCYTVWQRSVLTEPFLIAWTFGHI